MYVCIRIPRVRFGTDKKPISTNKFILSLKWFICDVQINQKNTIIYSRRLRIIYTYILLITETAVDITISYTYTYIYICVYSLVDFFGFIIIIIIVTGNLYKGQYL